MKTENEFQQNEPLIEYSAGRPPNHKPGEGRWLPYERQVVGKNRTLYWIWQAAPDLSQPPEVPTEPAPPPRIIGRLKSGAGIVHPDYDLSLGKNSKKTIGTFDETSEDENQ